MKFKYLFLVAAATLMMQSCGNNSSSSNAKNDSTAVASVSQDAAAPEVTVETSPAVAALPKLAEHKFTITDSNCGFHIDVLNANPYVENRTFKFKGNVLELSGWAIDLDNMKPISHLYAEVNGKIYEGKIGLDRADVKDAFKLSFSNIGFQIALPTADVKAGDVIRFYMEGEKEDFISEPIVYTVTEKI